MLTHAGVHVRTRSHIHNYAACMLQWDHLCSKSTPLFSMPLLFSPLPYLSLLPLTLHSFSLLFPPLSSLLFCRPPTLLPLSSLSLPLSLSRLLPLEAGDVEGCSAVSDYQACLCERNDNHCAALQRERERREGAREREEKGGKRGMR